MTTDPPAAAPSRWQEAVIDRIVPRTRRVVSVQESTSVDEIALILTSNRFKRVPVLRGHRVVGIVSRADIVRMIASRWICPTCGAIQHGRSPDACYSCGGDGSRFERDMAPRMEITSRQ